MLVLVHLDLDGAARCDGGEDGQRRGEGEGQGEGAPPDVPRGEVLPGGGQVQANVHADHDHVQEEEGEQEREAAPATVSSAGNYSLYYRYFVDRNLFSVNVHERHVSGALRTPPRQAVSRLRPPRQGDSSPVPLRPGEWA